MAAAIVVEVIVGGIYRIIQAEIDAPNCVARGGKAKQSASQGRRKQRKQGASKAKRKQSKEGESKCVASRRMQGTISCCCCETLLPLPSSRVSTSSQPPPHPIWGKHEHNHDTCSLSLSPKPRSVVLESGVVSEVCEGGCRSPIPLGAIEALSSPRHKICRSTWLVLTCCHSSCV